MPIQYEREWLASSSERKLLAAQQCFHALEFLANNKRVHCDIKRNHLMDFLYFQKIHIILKSLSLQTFLFSYIFFIFF